MTVKTVILDRSRIWDTQIKNDLEPLKRQIEQLVTGQDIEPASLEKLSEIETLFYSAVETEKLQEKSQKLLQLSNLFFQLLDIVDRYGIKKLLRLTHNIESLGRRTEVHAKFLAGANYIIVAEFEADLLEKAKKYSIGFEIIARIIEESWQDNTEKENKVEESKHSLTPFLKHRGQTAEEQLQKNQAAMKLLKGWIEEEVSEEESKERKNYFDSFKEIVDNERPLGHKLYSQE